VAHLCTTWTEAAASSIVEAMMFRRHTERRLETLLTDHVGAVAEFVERAKTLSNAQWLTPRAHGKWTPAQETKHVILAYDAFLRQLTEGTPMRLRGNALKRRIWRLIGLTSILWRKRIPVAVNAPREVRPDVITSGPDELLPDLRRRAEEFDVAFAHAWRNEPRRRMTHYMFGTLSLDQGIRLVSVHTRHHAAFLPQSQKDPST
jgi:hypothetical protein